MHDQLSLLFCWQSDAARGAGVLRGGGYGQSRRPHRKRQAPGAQRGMPVLEVCGVARSHSTIQEHTHLLHQLEFEILFLNQCPFDRSIWYS